MEYTNPELPEGINASTEHPLKEFFWLLASVLAAGFVLVLVAILLADTLSSHIPFRLEQKFADRSPVQSASSPHLESYLNELAARIVQAEMLPEGVTVRVHYLDTDMVNAFATLGGNIYMCRGLLKQLPHENALAMVLAHEIAHVKNRDPIRGAGRVVVLGLALSMISGDLGDTVLDNVLAQQTNLTLLKFSRDQERLADDEALDALQTLYGHTEGAAALFEALQKDNKGELAIEFFNSHPLTETRIAKARNRVTTEGQLNVTPLPEGYLVWLESTKNRTSPDDSPQK